MKMMGHDIWKIRPCMYKRCSLETILDVYVHEAFFFTMFPGMLHKSRRPVEMDSSMGPSSRILHVKAV